MAGSGLAHDGTNAQRLPVTVLVGFLGAGKTTVLNHVLGQSSGIAVLINEFGARPVDQALLRAPARRDRPVCAARCSRRTRCAHASAGLADGWRRPAAGADRPRAGGAPRSGAAGIRGHRRRR